MIRRVESFARQNDGTEFFGDVKIVLKEKLHASEPDILSFKRKIKSGGLQTSDKCETVGGFASDSPVDLLWEQKGDECHE